MTPRERPAPLTVSMVVLSYNQEKYVADAVRGVLEQDCFPIQIVISDDASTDGTFEAIKNAVSGYDGPHNVQVRQNAENLGLVAHLNLVPSLVSGDVIIPAYGDDISLPMRVANVVEAFSEGTPLLVHSDAIAIDENGHKTHSNYRKADFYNTTDALETATSMALYLGAAGAWHRSLFTKYGPLDYPNIYDDHILGFRAALEGHIAFIEKPLLKYREGVGISHKLGRDSAQRDAASARRVKILDMMIATFSQRLKDAQTFGHAPDHPIVLKLNRERRRAQMRRACHGGVMKMLGSNLCHPAQALSAALAEGLRIARRR